MPEAEGDLLDSRKAELYIRIHSGLFRERNSRHAHAVTISSLPALNSKRSAGVYPLPRRVVKKNEKNPTQHHARRRSLEARQLVDEEQQREQFLIPSTCKPHLHHRPRRLQHFRTRQQQFLYVSLPRWLVGEGEFVPAIRMHMQAEVHDSRLAAVGAHDHDLQDDLDMIEIVARANSVHMEPDRLLPGIRVAPCAFHGRPLDLTAGLAVPGAVPTHLPDAPGIRPHKILGTALSSHAHATGPSSSRTLQVTRGQQTRPKQRELTKKNDWLAPANGHTLFPAPDKGVDVIDEDTRHFRPSELAAEMSSSNVVMRWLKHGSGEESHFPQIIQPGNKNSRSPGPSNIQIRASFPQSAVGE